MPRDRVLVVAATSAKQATAILHKSMDGLTDEDVRVEEMGQVIEILNGAISQRQPRLIPKERAASEKAILRALVGNPGASPSDIAQRLGVSTVDVRRVETKHRLRLPR
jgi:hypothetical protein